MINWKRVSELREEIGTEDFEEVVEIFLEEVEEEIDRLRTQSSPDNLENTMHFLKGSALNLGFSKFAELCQRGETAAADGESLNLEITAVTDCFDQSKAAFLDQLSVLDTA